MRRVLLLSMILLAVTVAGCLDSGGDGTNTTVRVTENDGLSATFRSLSATYLEDADIRLQMDIENTGQAEAADIAVDLSGTGLISGNDLVQDPVTRLRPVDPGSGEQGGSTTAVWTAPNELDLEDGATQPVTVTGGLTYTYETTADASFNVVPRDAFEGDTDPVTAENTAAPVHATVDLRTPHPVFTERSRNILDVPVTIRNVGDGDATDITFSASLPNVGDQVTLMGCAGVEPSGFPVEGNELATLQEIEQGGTATLVCRVDLRDLTDTLRFESTVPVQIELSYTYTEEDQAGFTIEGLPGTPGEQ